MTLKFIKKLIKEWYITSAWWRLLESAIICWITYLLWAIISWEALSFNWLIVAIITPIYLYMTKKERDNNK